MEGSTSPERRWPRRHWKWLAGAAVAALVALAIGTAVSWHFSSQVLVPDHSSWPEEIDVEAVARDRIVLSLLRTDEDSVTRRLRSVQGYLETGMKVAIESAVYAGDPRQSLGLPFRQVPVRGELGPMPAWIVPARGETWAIVVHGINSTPRTGLRVVPALRGAGLPSMLITYREDLGAPPSPDGYHHMGLTEWRDLQSAARYALAHGARRLVLVGYSMGGSLVTQFMQHSELAGRVSGLVLDAPALDWQEILSFNATQMGLPGISAKPVEWAVGARIDADWEDLDALRHTDALQLPILLLHGTEDDVVPIATSEDLAAELPRWVTYYHAPGAGHTEAWNVDPPLYERRLTGFLARIGAVTRGR